MNIFGKNGGPAGPGGIGGAGGMGPRARAGGPGGAGAGGAGASAITSVAERDFEQEVMRSELPVLLQFMSERSAACKQVAPDLEAFARDMAGKVKVVNVDVEKAQLLARELRIQAIPTWMVFAGGRPVDGVAGPIDKKKMRALVEPFLPRAAGAIKAPELAQLFKEQPGAVVPVDTRDAAAFGRAHLPHAVHMPLEELEGRMAELYMLPGQPVVYCRSGDKTKELTAKLAEQGVEMTFLEGGLLGWESEGFAIERGERGG